MVPQQQKGPGVNPGSKKYVPEKSWKVSAARRDTDHMRLSRADGLGSTGLTPYPENALTDAMETGIVHVCKVKAPFPHT